MQVNLTPSNVSRPNFTAIHIQDGAKEILKKRLNKISDWNKLENLIDSQTDSYVDIVLSGYNNSRLSGWTVPKDYAMLHSIARKDYTESIFYKFKNPLSFIENLCNKADILNNKIKASISLKRVENILNKAN